MSKKATSPQDIQYMLNADMIEPDSTYLKNGDQYGKVDEHTYKLSYISDGVYLWRYQNNTT